MIHIPPRDGIVDRSRFGQTGSVVVKAEELQLRSSQQINELMSKVRRRRSSGRKHSHGAVPSVRPWVRYWARMFDILLFSLAAAFLIRLFASRSLPEKSSVQALEIFILFVWAFVEAALLSAFGATPGKWLFKVKLTPQDGSHLIALF